MNKKQANNMMGLFFVLLTVYGAFYVSNAQACENEIITEAFSPNNTYLAVYFQRSCRNKPMIKTQIAVVKATASNRDFYHGQGNVLSMIGEPPQEDLILEWSGNDVLIVTGKITSKIDFKHESIGISGRNINIRYKQQ